MRVRAAAHRRNVSAGHPGYLAGVTLFRINQALYHTFLGVWLGAMVMLVLAATAAFAFVTGPETTVQATIEGFRSPLTGSDANGWVAGGIVGTAIARLEVLQLVCFAVVGLATAAQCTLFRARLATGATSPRNLLRMLLLLGPVAIVAFNLAVVGPGIDEHRSAKYDPATEPQARATAEAAFDRYHGLSTRTYGAATLLLLGASLLSPWCLEGRSMNSEPAGTNDG